MKHTNFTFVLKEIKAIELKELTEAIEKLGGYYKWPDCEGPVVLAETDMIAEVFTVKYVHFDDDGDLVVHGEWRDEYNRLPLERKFCNIYPDTHLPVGEISTILDKLPNNK